MTKRGAQLNAETQAQLKQFAAMPVGRSFFIADIRRVDVEYLRRPAIAMGLGIRIVQVAIDEIYQQPGVRIWREEGTYDEL